MIFLVGGVAGQGAGQLAANASAPFAANAIGEYFAQPGHENQTAQVLTHAVLGAILAVANGGSAAAGAGAGASGELAAQVLTRELYPDAYDANGTFHPEKLDAGQLNTVIGLSTAVGALVAGATGGSLLDASVGGSIAQNAATNNWLSQKNNGIRLSQQRQFDAAQKKCTDTGDCTARDNLLKISALQDASLNAACTDRASAACGAAINYAQANGNTVILGGNGQFIAYPTGSPTIQAIPDPRQGTFESAQAANLNDALQYVAIDSATGLAVKGIFSGAKAILGGADALLGGVTKGAAETAIGANSGKVVVTATDIPEILGQATRPYGTTGTTASVNSNAELNTLFGKLTEGGFSPVIKPYGTEVTLTDGTTVTLRNSSSSGGATIDVNYKGSLGVPGNFKVHINQ